ncbi:MAG: DUF1330 domain-containing protein [Mesorhizobium sp.]|nr:MAG: DUF1330 domain-containing protein [Mesorhizobium sp.]TKB97189.1 MAG: DUF1330 domain-containing protein [Mesorhizobium sp.]
MLQCLSLESKVNGCDLIAGVDIPDASVFGVYRRDVPVSEALRGRYIPQGATKVLDGEWEPHRLVIVEFPSHCPGGYHAHR